jgi:hypothetical protein
MASAASAFWHTIDGDHVDAGSYSLPQSRRVVRYVDTNLSLGDGRHAIAMEPPNRGLEDPGVPPSRRVVLVDIGSRDARSVGTRDQYDTGFPYDLGVLGGEARVAEGRDVNAHTLYDGCEAAPLFVDDHSKPADAAYTEGEFLVV